GGEGRRAAARGWGGARRRRGGWGSWSAEEVARAEGWMGGQAVANPGRMTGSDKTLPARRSPATGGPMRTELEKMLAGELYDPLDPALIRARERARDLCQDLNATRERDQETRRRILKELFGRGGESVWMQPPFFCDY